MNFTLTELGRINNNNLKRIFTGTLLGFSIGFALYEFFNRNFICGLIVIVWIFLLEIIVAIILYRANVLEKFFKQYEDGVYKE